MRQAEVLAGVPDCAGVYVLENVVSGYFYVGSSRHLRRRCYQWFLNQRNASSWRGFRCSLRMRGVLADSVWSEWKFHFPRLFRSDVDERVLRGAENSFLLEFRNHPLLLNHARYAVRYVRRPDRWSEVNNVR